MHHASLVCVAVMCSVLLVCLLALSHNTNSKLRALMETQEMPIPPQELTLTTAWCHRKDDPPPPLHTKVEVKTTRQPGEDIEDFVARHNLAVTEAEEAQSRNCEEHTY